LKSSKENEFGNTNTFFFLPKSRDGKKGHNTYIYIPDQHVLPLKAFELNGKTQVGSRIDSLNHPIFTWHSRSEAIIYFLGCGLERQTESPKHPREIKFFY
jgi:hypothetical protein